MNPIKQETMSDYENLPQMGAFMDIRVDWAFHYVMSDKAVLEKFLRDILQMPVEMLELLPNAIPVRSEKDKRATFDVICRNTDTGEQFIVEMQRRGESDMDDRLFFYGASLVHGQVAAGDPVYWLNPVYVICVADYVVHHEAVAPDQFLFHYRFSEVETGEMYGSQLQLYRLELRRALVDCPWEELENDLDRWCYIFRKMSKFAGRPPQESGFGAVFERAQTDLLSESQRTDYRKAMLTEYDKYTIGEYARAEGRAEGLKAGRADEKRDIADKMLAMGLPVETVAKATGLGIEEIQTLSVQAKQG